MQMSAIFATTDFYTWNEDRIMAYFRDFARLSSKCLKWIEDKKIIGRKLFVIFADGQRINDYAKLLQLDETDTALLTDAILKVAKANRLPFSLQAVGYGEKYLELQDAAERCTTVSMQNTNVTTPAAAVDRKLMSDDATVPSVITPPTVIMPTSLANPIKAAAAMVPSVPTTPSRLPVPTATAKPAVVDGSIRPSSSNRPAAASLPATANGIDGDNGNETDTEEIRRIDRKNGDKIVGQLVKSNPLTRKQRDDALDPSWLAELQKPVPTNAVDLEKQMRRLNARRPKHARLPPLDDFAQIIALCRMVGVHRTIVPMRHSKFMKYCVNEELCRDPQQLQSLSRLLADYPKVEFIDVRRPGLAWTTWNRHFDLLRMTLAGCNKWKGDTDASEPTDKSAEPTIDNWNENVDPSSSPARIVPTTLPEPIDIDEDNKSDSAISHKRKANETAVDGPKRLKTNPKPAGIPTYLATWTNADVIRYFSRDDFRISKAAIDALTNANTNGDDLVRFLQDASEIDALINDFVIRTYFKDALDLLRD